MKEEEENKWQFRGEEVEKGLMLYSSNGSSYILQLIQLVVLETAAAAAAFFGNGAFFLPLLNAEQDGCKMHFPQKEKKMVEEIYNCWQGTFSPFLFTPQNSTNTQKSSRKIT